MRIFLDTASLEEIQQGVKLGVVSGVTTNPTLVARERLTDYKSHIQQICGLVDGPVSVEVIAQDVEGMVKEGLEFIKWAPNVVVKLPTTSAGLEGTAILAQEGIPVNQTLCFSANQALLASLAGATYVSPFLGRLDDAGHDGMEVVSDAVQIFRTYSLKTQVLAASIRHPLHCVQAAKLGAHIGTMPFKVLIQMIAHPFTDVGLARFMEDWQKAQISHM